MNLTSLKERLLDLGEKVGLKVESETADSLSFGTEITAKQYFDGSIYFHIVVYRTGTLHVFFTFNEIERTYDNLYLINTFNSENPWFRAYITNINDKDFLELHYVSIDAETEDEVSDTIGYLLGDLLKDNILKYLTPIVKAGK